MTPRPVIPFFLNLSVVFILVFTGTTACSTQIHAQALEGGRGKAPYIFVQQHNLIARQIVRTGWPLQVQLPGNPTVWTFQKDQSTNVETRGHAIVYSPGRIAGTDSLFIFDFVLAPDVKAGDQGVITITTRNAPMSLLQVVPDGFYQIKFTVAGPAGPTRPK